MTDGQSPRVRSVLRLLDTDALRDAARRESRGRQVHLPPISAYRWWARRTETVSGAIIDAISADTPGPLRLADPFAGGGVIALAGLLRGHQVYAQDVNPWAARNLAMMLTVPPPDELDRAAESLRSAVAPLLERAYHTKMADGSPGEVAHTLSVATAPCPNCSRTLRLYPIALVSLTSRVDCGGDFGYLACPAGHLNHTSATKRTSCQTCGRYIRPTARYTTDRVVRCVDCGWRGKLAELAGVRPFWWEPVLVERVANGRREIGLPTADELAAASPAAWAPTRELPAIAAGVETAVLLRHGYRRWHDLYPARQRAVLEALLAAITTVAAGDPVLELALEAAVVGSVEMAGHLTRWDARYLKPYEAIANHRFNVTTFVAELNVWGAQSFGRGTVSRRIEHLSKASSWLEERIGRPLAVQGPVAAGAAKRPLAKTVDARVAVGSSAQMCLPAGSLHAVVTDPPYHDDVQYGELSDLFRAWTGYATGPLDGDAVVRRTDENSGIEAYTRLLLDVFTEVRRTLRPGGHLVLSYANRHPRAWAALLGALESAGFRAVGYEVVHSENETDHAKFGRRACNLDVLIDLVADPVAQLDQHGPEGVPLSDEERFCRTVGTWALRVGSLPDGWENEFRADLAEEPFLL